MQIQIDTNIKTVSFNIKVEDLRKLTKSLYTFHSFDNFSSIYRKSSRWNFGDTKDEVEKYIRTSVIDNNLTCLLSAMDDFKKISSFYKDNFPLEEFIEICNNTIIELDKNKTWTIKKKARQ